MAQFLISQAQGQLYVYLLPFYHNQYWHFKYCMHKKFAITARYNIPKFHFSSLPIKGLKLYEYDVQDTLQS
jgi:hypothetical protein